MLRKLKANLPLVLLIIVTIVILMVVTLLAMSPEWMFQSGWKENDDILFNVIYAVHTRTRVYWLIDILGPLAFVLTQFGTLLALLFVGAIVYAKKKYRATFKVLLSGLGAYAAAGVMKMIVQRPRPMYEVVGDYARYEQGAGGYGYPSGHTAVAFAIALCLYFILKGPYRILLFPAAFLVGLSRVYLGVHFPLDIMGGACIGLLFAAIIELVSRLLLKWPASK